MQVRVGEAQGPLDDLAPAAIARGNSYTFNILDSGNLISADLEASITECALYVIDLVSRYVAWEGTMDFVVDIRPIRKILIPPPTASWPQSPRSPGETAPGSTTPSMKL